MAIILSLGVTSTELISFSCACSVSDPLKVVISDPEKVSGSRHVLSVQSWLAEINRLLFNLDKDKYLYLFCINMELQMAAIHSGTALRLLHNHRWDCSILGKLLSADPCMAGHRVISYRMAHTRSDYYFLIGGRRRVWLLFNLNKGKHISLSYTLDFEKHL